MSTLSRYLNVVCIFAFWVCLFLVTWWYNESLGFAVFIFFLGFICMWLYGDSALVHEDWPGDEDEHHQEWFTSLVYGDAEDFEEDFAEPDLFGNEVIDEDEDFDSAFAAIEPGSEIEVRADYESFEDVFSFEEDFALYQDPFWGADFKDPLFFASLEEEPLWDTDTNEIYNHLYEDFPGLDDDFSVLPLQRDELPSPEEEWLSQEFWEIDEFPDEQDENDYPEINDEYADDDFLEGDAWEQVMWDWFNRYFSFSVPYDDFAREIRKDYSERAESFEYLFMRNDAWEDEDHFFWDNEAAYANFLYSWLDHRFVTREFFQEMVEEVWEVIDGQFVDEQDGPDTHPDNDLLDYVEDLDLFEPDVVYEEQFWSPMTPFHHFFEYGFEEPDLRISFYRYQEAVDEFSYYEFLDIEELVLMEDFASFGLVTDVRQFWSFPVEGVEKYTFRSDEDYQDQYYSLRLIEEYKAFLRFYFYSLRFSSFLSRPNYLSPLFGSRVKTYLKLLRYVALHISPAFMQRFTYEDVKEWGTFRLDDFWRRSLLFDYSLRSSFLLYRDLRLVSAHLWSDFLFDVFTKQSKFNYFFNSFPFLIDSFSDLDYSEFLDEDFFLFDFEDKNISLSFLPVFSLSSVESADLFYLNDIFRWQKFLIFSFFSDYKELSFSVDRLFFFLMEFVFPSRLLIFFDQEEFFEDFVERYILFSFTDGNALVGTEDIYLGQKELNIEGQVIPLYLFQDNYSDAIADFNYDFWLTDDYTSSFYSYFYAWFLKSRISSVASLDESYFSYFSDVIKPVSLFHVLLNICLIYFSFFFHFFEEEFEEDKEDDEDWYYHDRQFSESFEEDEDGEDLLDDEEEALLMNDADELNTFDEYTAVPYLDDQEISVKEYRSHVRFYEDVFETDGFLFSSDELDDLSILDELEELDDEDVLSDNFDLELFDEYSLYSSLVSDYEDGMDPLHTMSYIITFGRYFNKKYLSFDTHQQEQSAFFYQTDFYTPDILEEEELDEVYNSAFHYFTDRRFGLSRYMLEYRDMGFFFVKGASDVFYFPRLNFFIGKGGTFFNSRSPFFKYFYRKAKGLFWVYRHERLFAEGLQRLRTGKLFMPSIKKGRPFYRLEDLYYLDDEEEDVHFYKNFYYNTKNQARIKNMFRNPFWRAGLIKTPLLRRRSEKLTFSLKDRVLLDIFVLKYNSKSQKKLLQEFRLTKLTFKSP